MRKLLAALIGAAFFVPQGAIHAQSWPVRPIKWIISFGPGSASDVLARIAGQELTQSLGQPVVVLPKPGADGALSALELKRSAADGYTFLFGSNSALAVAPSLHKEAGYNPVTDFTPITYLGNNTFFVVVNPSVPAKSLAELIAYAKANPNALNYPSPNTYALVATSIFAARNGIQMHSVPYKSEPDAIPDLLSGRVHVLFGTSTGIATFVKDGKLRALATTLPERSPLMPDVPSFPEVGQTKFPITAWFGLVGPPRLPQEIVKRMNKEMVAVLAKPSVRELMLRQGFVAKSSPPEELGAYIKEQVAVWKDALKTAGVEPQ